MLSAVPCSFFSWGFKVYCDSELLAIIDVAWLSEGGSFDYQGNTYNLRKAGFLSTEFSIEENGSVIASASKTAMIRLFEVDYNNTQYTLRAASPLTRKFVIECGNEKIGQIAPNVFFARSCSIEIPDDIPIPVQMFMFWLVILMWRRSSNSASFAASQ
ncbi:MAG: hypothetical protein KAS23_00885 [Anaerohalosphaera sp.]|nr:hypothetical protein [Anaerohalosphaera sp.]